MAVYAAHLTRTLAGTPSIFEITAQEQLASTVRPALKKLVEFIASWNPNKFSWLVQWYDEVYLLFNSVLQYHYLRHYAASFAESFYGLQRVATTPVEFTDGFHLPPRNEQLSLALIVVLPYVRARLEGLVERYRDLDRRTDKNWRETCTRLLVHLYTVLHAAYEGLALLTSLGYMTGRLRSATPALAAAGVALTYAGNIASDDDGTWSELWQSVVSGRLGSATITFGMVGGAVLRAVEVGAFFIQFLKWWQTAGTAAAILPVPTAPELDPKAERLTNKCPVCLQTWRVPTALAVSGFVYCYKCISRSVREDGRCPVTGYPARADQLVRVYLDR